MLRRTGMLVAVRLAEKNDGSNFFFAVSLCNRRDGVELRSRLPCFRIDAFSFQEDCRHAASKK
jgi:hypothetical protein